MQCPVCLHVDTKVIDSRVASDGLSIRRRRECLKCGFRFSTYEEVEILELTVIKKDGQKQAYNRDKIIDGLKRSLVKRPITADSFKKLVNSIERDLQVLRKNELASYQIGKIIMRELKKVDKVAYVRFASVYENFDDIQIFQETLNKLSRRKRKQNITSKT